MHDQKHQEHNHQEKEEQENILGVQCNNKKHVPRSIV